MNTSKTILSKVNNTIFLLSTILVLSFFWIQYYVRNFFIAFISSIIILASFCIIYFPIKHKINRKSLNKSDDKFLEYLTTQLLYGKENLNILTIAKAYNLKNLSEESHNHFVSQSDGIDYYFLFSNIVSTDDILNVFKNRIYDNIEIFCLNQIAPIPLISNCKISIHNLREINEKLSERSLSLDQGIKIEKMPKPSLKDVLCIILGKDKAKGYFWFGLMLIFWGMFTIYHIYYILTGTALILLSLYCKFRRQKIN